jgi:serine/threonine-protein kinase
MSAVTQQVGLPPRYRVVRHIANGGMATVWAAEDAVLERLVAVKVLAPGYAADPAARRRFTREARAAARVSDHQNVVTIFDTGEHDGQAFIVMEHFAGGTVADRLKSGNPRAGGIPVPLALRWLRETASALDAAHDADIVHRDVKPGNLLLDENGRLAVGDFGIASLAGETAVTAAGQVLGTAAYLSPEQARGEAATPASDRYSLAVVAYELLCGRRPFAGETAMAQARARVEQDPEIPTGPCGLAGDALKHGLAREPADRPATALAFVAELEAALGDAVHPTRATAVMTPVPGPEPIARPRHPRRNAVILALVAALCVAVGAGAALITDNGNDGGRSATPKATASKSQGAPTGGVSRAADDASSPQSATTETPAPAPSDDGRSAAALNNEGYALLPGNPQGAVPLLSRAVEKFRASGDTSSQDYAFSLYNYGWALRLAGRPAEAIPYLQERLRISSYKRGIVKQELRTAQTAAAGD